jgi:hypothetical protein
MIHARYDECSTIGISTPITSKMRITNDYINDNRCNDYDEYSECVYVASSRGRNTPHGIIVTSEIT